MTRSGSVSCAMLADDRMWTAARCGDVRLLGRGAGDEWVMTKCRGIGFCSKGHAQIRECAVAEIEMRIWTVGLDVVGRPRYYGS